MRQVVALEPSEEMMEAIKVAYSAADLRFESMDDVAKRIYEAMRTAESAKPKLSTEECSETVAPEILVLAAEMCDGYDAHGLEPHRLEQIVRAVVLRDRALRSSS